MFGDYFGKQEIVELMLDHPIAKLSYSKIERKIIQNYGPLLFKLFGYPLGVAARQRASVIMKYLDPKKGERILDAGCGIGYYSFELATKFGCEMEGIDVDKADIELANKISSITKVMNTNFKVCDVNKLDFPDNTFDKVVLSEVLEHIYDDRKVLTEICRILKPDGHFILSTPHVDEIEEYNHQKPKIYTNKSCQNIKGGHVRNGYSLKMLTKLLDDAGFDVAASCFIQKIFTINVGFPFFLFTYPISTLDKLTKGKGKGIVVKTQKRL